MTDQEILKEIRSIIDKGATSSLARLLAYDSIKILFIKETNLKDQKTEFYRPYNVEKRRLKSLVNFGVISEYLASKCLEEFKGKEYALAKIIDRGEN